MVKILQKLRSGLAGKSARSALSMEDMWIPATDARALVDEQQMSGDLSNNFFENKGQITHKWLHFFPIYEQYFARYRNTDFKMLEIGVYRGGSLDMWRRYFGDGATIFGIDVNPECAGFAHAPNEVRIGSQADPKFLTETVREMGGLDLVLDDGSHYASHQKASFETLFPLLADGGLYTIEDTHSSYWPGEFEGGYRRKDTAIEMAKDMIDDMHHWYHDRDLIFAAGGDIGAVHVLDSVIVIEKRTGHSPKHTQTGAAAGPLPV